MKLPFYIEPLEEYEIDIKMPAHKAKQMLHSIYIDRTFDRASDAINPSMIYHHRTHFRVKVSDDRRASDNYYMHSYYARIELVEVEGGNCKAKVCLVYDHGHSFGMLIVFLINLLALIFFLIASIAPIHKILYGIYFLVSAILVAISIFTENKKFLPDLERIRSAVTKYTDMVNRWDN